MGDGGDIDDDDDNDNKKECATLLAVSDRQCMSKDLSKWFSFFFLQTEEGTRVD